MKIFKPPFKIAGEHLSEVLFTECMSFEFLMIIEIKTYFKLLFSKIML